MSHSQPFQQLVPSIPLGIGKADVLSNGVEAYRAPAQRRRDQRVPRLDGRAVALLRNRKFADSPMEGSGFELPVPQCALSSPTAREAESGAWMIPDVREIPTKVPGRLAEASRMPG